MATPAMAGSSDLVIDLRTVQIGMMTPEIVETFRELSTGHHFVLVSDHSPIPLLHHAQELCGDQLHWSVLEEGPELWRFEIAKWAEGPRDVATLLEVDHDRLDALLETAIGETRGHDPNALVTFREFKAGLTRHIRLEEQAVFPVFEESTGITDGPTAVMRHEHAAMKLLVDDVERALLRGEVPEPLFARLLQMTGSHNEEEENVLYPMTDRALDEAGRLALVRRMQLL